MKTLIQLFVENLPEMVAIVISLFALAFSVWQFYSERKRNRKEATIHAFDELGNTESVLYLFNLSQNEIDELVKRQKLNDNRIKDQWADLTKALALIEHFAVGVNTKVYDLETLNRMAGNKILDVFSNCENLIKYKRKNVGDENNYSEFEQMKNALIQHRKKNV